MKRRGFLSCLPFLAPAVVAAVPKQENPDDFEWEGCRVKWRDYVGEQASDRLEGFWTAWPIREEDRNRQYPYFVSMTSRDWNEESIVSRYNPGNAFRMGCLMITRQSSDDEKETAKTASLAALKQFILDEKKPEPEYTFKFSGFKAPVGGSYDPASEFPVDQVVTVDLSAYHPEGGPLFGEVFSDHPLLDYARLKRG